MNYLLDIIFRKNGVSVVMLKREQKFLMFRGLWIFVFLSILISCVSISKEYGYFPSNKDVEKLVIGKSNKGQIKNLIGPATVLDRYSWIYVSSKVRSVGFLSPSVTDRNILLLKFSKENVLLKKEIFTISDGKIFDIRRDEVVNDPRRISALKQLFGNMSNFSAETFIADN